MEPDPHEALERVYSTLPPSDWNTFREEAERRFRNSFTTVNGKREQKWLRSLEHLNASR